MEIKDKQKMSFRVYEVLLGRFNKEFQNLPLARDQFISNLIRTECECLAADLEGKRLSDEAKVFIANRLRSMEKGTRPVSIVIDTNVVARLNEIVEKTNIVRDAFLNRILYFLLLTVRLRNHLDLPDELNQFQIISKRKSELRWENIPVSPIEWLAQVLADPFCYLREELSRHNEGGNKLYLMPMEEEFVGFTCFAEYSELPGTDAYKRQQEEFSDLIMKI